MNWDFVFGLGHFGASRTFLMKTMSLKRMIDGELEKDEESDLFGSEPMPYQPQSRIEVDKVNMRK